MPGARPDPADLDTLLAKLEPAVRELVLALRAAITGVLPDNIEEQVHLGWGVVHYKAGKSMRDVFIAIDPQRNWANLAFGDGVDLDDRRIASKVPGSGCAT